MKNYKNIENKNARNLETLLLNDADIPKYYKEDDTFEIHVKKKNIYNNNNYKNYYVKCISCDLLGECQGSGFVCSCKFNVYELYNLCQCVSCNQIVPFITNVNTNEKISFCHPIITLNGVKNLKKIKKR
jgi:hypothetical protein